MLQLLFSVNQLESVSTKFSLHQTLFIQKKSVRCSQADNSLLEFYSYQKVNEGSSISLKKKTIYSVQQMFDLTMIH